MASSKAQTHTASADQSRTWGMLLWIVALCVAIWAGSEFDKTQVLANQAKATSGQLERAKAAKARAAKLQADSQALQTAQRAAFLSSSAQFEQLREQTAAHASEARNTVELLALVKKACDASGLRDCQVSRSSAPVAASAAANTPANAASGGASGATAQATPIPLTEYPVKLVGSLEQENFLGVFEQLAKSGRLYRLTRTAISGRRVELDFVFWLNDKGALSAARGQS